MNIKTLRKQIDEIDDTILKLLVSREELVTYIGELKNTKGTSILDAEREEEIIARLKKKAEENDLNPELVEKLIKLIMDHSKKVQESCKEV